MKRALFIYNPKSGNGNITRYIDMVIAKSEEKGFVVIPHRITNDEYLDEFLQEVCNMDIDRTIIAGGDGTIHRIINKLYLFNIECKIGILAVGTANDFAYHLNIPKQIDDMIDLSFSDEMSKCDIGKANNEYFINVASMGFLIDISQRTNPNLKNNIGVLAYYIKGIEELPRLKPIKIDIESDECTLKDQDIYFMLIMNGKSAGGFKKISPTSLINDGYLDVIIFKKTTLIDIVPLVINLVNGEHINNANVIHFQTKKLRIDCKEQDIGTDLDGEVGPNFPINISIAKKSLSICSTINSHRGDD